MINVRKYKVSILCNNEINTGGVFESAAASACSFKCSSLRLHTHPALSSSCTASDAFRFIDCNRST